MTWDAPPPGRPETERAIEREALPLATLLFPGVRKHKVDWEDFKRQAAEAWAAE